LGQSILKASSFYNWDVQKHGLKASLDWQVQSRYKNQAKSVLRFMP
jgi:hypothetical protein